VREKEDVVKKRSDPELYWVIKNGIKMAGVPAFGFTHSEDELWGMVAFVRRLPNLKPKEYKALIRRAHLHEMDGNGHPLVND
jgi:mono/diheme cytochrome c family protein